MKKKIGIALVLALALVLSLGTVVSADPPFEPTSVDIDWVGGGWVGARVIGGDDAITTFSTDGSHIEGTFTADYTAGGYAYMEVNTLTSRLDASVNGGGYIEYQTERTDSYGGWGAWEPAGQESYSFVGTDDGNASMGTGSRSSLDGLVDDNYPLLGTLAVDNATNYNIIRYLSVGNILTGDFFTGVQAHGSGSAVLQCRRSRALNYAELGVASYANAATFNAVGGGTFDLYARGDNGATINSITMTGSTSGSFNWLGNLDVGSLPTVTATDAGSGASLDIIANFISNFDMGDYSIRAW